MTDPDQQRRSLGGDAALPTGGSGGRQQPPQSHSVDCHQAQERQLGDREEEGTLVDRVRAEALVLRLARQERDVWVTWPARVAALMAAQVATEVEKTSGNPVIIDAAIFQGAGCPCPRAA